MSNYIIKITTSNEIEGGWNVYIIPEKFSTFKEAKQFAEKIISHHKMAVNPVEIKPNILSELEYILSDLDLLNYKNYCHYDEDELEFFQRVLEETKEDDCLEENREKDPYSKKYWTDFIKIKDVNGADCLLITNWNDFYEKLTHIEIINPSDEIEMKISENEAVNIIFELPGNLFPMKVYGAINDTVSLYKEIKEKIFDKKESLI